MNTFYCGKIFWKIYMYLVKYVSNQFLIIILGFLIYEFGAS